MSQKGKWVRDEKCIGRAASLETYLTDSPKDFSSRRHSAVVFETVETGLGAIQWDR